MAAKVSSRQIEASVKELQAAIDSARDKNENRPSWRVRRSEETRRSIMETTIKCLVDLGYANTTTQVIADTIGLSRGAMVHHYSTRMDIINATIDHIFLRMLELVYEGVENLADKSEITHSDSADLHWKVLSSDVYLAYIELKMAGRTDAELRSNFDPKAIAFDRVWLDCALEILPHWNGDKEGARLAWNFGRATLEGLKLNERIVRIPADRKVIRQVLTNVMKQMEAGTLKPD